ncbi:MAG TPA: pseudouridine synthase, partial [Burkholderiaceae bacterium]|nr:pseudouridine synthase [Burkholderiaceae bacterium]
MKDLGKDSKHKSDTPQLAADRVTHLTVSDEDAGQRLDNFLFKRCKGVPKSHVYRVIRSGEVRVDGKRAAPDQRLDAGTQLRVPPIRIAQRPQTAPAAEFPILFEDNDLLAIDKPAGVAVHGGSGVSHGVIEQLRASRSHVDFLELVHRLDKETSGVLLLAKKRRALVGLHEQLQGGTTDKRYAAL